MVNYFTIGKNDVSNIYSRIRTTHERELVERRRKLYTEWPELAEMDRQITEANTRTIRKILTLSPSEAEKAKKDRLQLVKQRREERNRFLQEHGIKPEDLELSYDCPICKDEGIIDGKRCICFQKHMLKLLYRQSSLENVLEKENFDTFSFDFFSPESVDGLISPLENITEIHAKSKDFSTNFKADGRSFLFTGGAGTGKTFMSHCIAKEMMDRGHSVLYVTANELFENILAPYIMFVEPDAKERLKSVYELVYNAELLVLDDLGTEMTNSFTLSQLFEVINRRMLSDRSTLISTNLSLKQLRDKYQERIVSRIIERYDICHFYGNNIRSKKKTEQLKHTED